MHSKTFVAMAASVGVRVGPIRHGVTPKRILDHVLQDMTRLKADNCLNPDPDTVEYLKGMWDAYKSVAHYIAPLTDMKNGSSALANSHGPANVVGQVVSAVSG